MPSAKVKLLHRAELELTEACSWYEGEKKGLSVRLRKEVGTALNTIARNPYLYTTKYDNDLRFAPLKKFPYIVVYWFDQNLNTVFITSVFHTSRNPKRFE